MKVTTYARLFTSYTMKRARETYGMAEWQLNTKGRIATFAEEFWQKYIDRPFEFAQSRFARRALIDIMLEIADTKPPCLPLDSDCEESLPDPLPPSGW